MVWVECISTYLASSSNDENLAIYDYDRGRTGTGAAQVLGIGGSLTKRIQLKDWVNSSFSPENEGHPRRRKRLTLQS